MFVALPALSRMAAAHATVLRGGRPISIPTADVVPGDIVLLSEGDTVAAGGRLFAAAALVLVGSEVYKLALRAAGRRA